jgi:hypothetical protein
MGANQPAIAAKWVLKSIAPMGRSYGHFAPTIKESLIKLIPFTLRQAQRERNQLFTVRPELVEGLIQSILKVIGGEPMDAWHSLERMLSGFGRFAA